jgi:hypothetical protein
MNPFRGKSEIMWINFQTIRSPEDFQYSRTTYPQTDPAQYRPHNLSICNVSQASFFEKFQTIQRSLISPLSY